MKFLFDIDGVIELGADEVFEDPEGLGGKSSADAVAEIEAKGSSLATWLSDWNLEQDVTVTVNGLEIKFR